MTEQEERQVWHDAIDEVLELLRIHPPSRIGEAAFMRRLVNLKGKYDENTTSKSTRTHR